MVTPEEFITELRGSDRYIVDIFSKGSCYKLYKMLKLIFPQAKPYKCGYVDRDGQEDLLHVVTDIGGVLYDIEGIFDPKVKKEYTIIRLMSEEDEQVFERYSYSRLWWIPDCDECPVAHG